MYECRTLPSNDTTLASAPTNVARVRSVAGLDRDCIRQNGRGLAAGRDARQAHCPAVSGTTVRDGCLSLGNCLLPRKEARRRCRHVAPRKQGSRNGD
jgi:hypothetical protein